MEFKQAIKNIEKEYKIRWASSTCVQIDTDQFLDAFNYCFVSILDEDGRALITDFADNMEVITLPIERVQEICKQHNIVWNNYHLECEYTSNDDIKRYFECLQQITDEM